MPCLILKTLKGLQAFSIIHDNSCSWKEKKVKSPLMNFANLILLMFLYFNLDLSLSLELFRVLDERLEVVNNQD